jgi:protocatechuate 3,4-dioxygenase beta subunit
MHNWEHYRRLPAYFLMATLVASCGGGSDTLSLNGQSSAAIVDAPAKILAAVDSSTSFSVRLTDGGLPVAGKVVAISLSSGTAKLTKTSTVTDSNGVATFSLSGNGVVEKGTIVATYIDSANNIARQTIAYEVLDGTGLVSTYQLSSSATSPINILTSGNTTATITVTLKDASGLPVKDALLEFTLPSNVVGVGRINASSARTNALGQASVVIDALNQTAGDNQLSISYKDSFKSVATLLVPFKVVNKYDILLSASSDKLKTGDTPDSVVLTATVVDASQLLVSGAKVSFKILSNSPVDNPPLSTDPCPQDVTNLQQFKPTALSSDTIGSLTKSDLTNVNGQTTAIFSVKDNKNGNRRILATIDNQAVACVDLKLAGTILTLEPEVFNATSGKSFPITGTIKNARGLGVKNAAVNFVIGSIPQAKTYTTNSNGVVVSDPFIATSNVSIGAKSDALGIFVDDVKPTQVLISDLGVGVDFLNAAKQTITEQPIQQVATLLVKAKDIKGHVSLGSTLGTLTKQELTLVNGEATTTISSNFPGTARIDVRIVKDNGEVVTGIGSLRFISTTPQKMTLQSSLSTLNSGEQAEIQAKVLDARDNPVKGAKVNFRRVNDPSNGSLSSSIALTDENGKASVVFTAGPNDTGKDKVEITSEIFDVNNNVLVNGTPVKLTVGGQPVFISIATGKTLQVVNETVYALPMSIVVVDAAGHPVRDQSVSLDVIPTNYLKGIYYFDTVAKVWQTAALSPSVVADLGVVSPISCPNEDRNNNGILDTEDKNANGILDAGEDTNANGLLDLGDDVNNDGILWPGNPVTVSKNVVTDDTGRASFNVLYGKSYANWLDVKLIASVKVSGSESKAERDFYLPVLAADVTEQTVTPPGGTISPFGQTTYTITDAVINANGFVTTPAKVNVTFAPQACALKRSQGGLVR